MTEEEYVVVAAVPIPFAKVTWEGMGVALEVLPKFIVDPSNPTEATRFVGRIEVQI